MKCPDFSGLKILVLGDPMWDEYIFGRVDRVSPEAPVPVFVPERSESRCGGAANVREQLLALGCDAQGAWIDPHWTQKTRYMVGSHQLLRVDRDASVTNRIPALEGFSAVVISDYAKGACTPEICAQVIASGLPVIVDPKGTDWTKYSGCTVICPNHREYLERYRPALDDTAIILKRAADGIDLIEPFSSERTNFPAQARHVFDVTGAGDTVTAVIAACVAKGIALPDACRLANLAAGFVVGEVGTTVCPIEKLRELCE